MAKKRNRVVDYTVYTIIRLFAAFLRALPYAMACRVGDGIAWMVRKVDRRHRLVAKDNLQHAFPGRYSDAELDGVVANVYRHFCRMMVEMIHLDRRIHITNWRSYLEYASPADSERTVRTFLCGRPVLLVTPHFGNWEFSSYVMGILGFKMFAIARPLDNPYLDAWMRRWREATGQKMIAKKGEYEKIEGVLKAGNVLGTLGDQDAGARGLFVNFFNRPASTHKAVALLAIEYNVPLLVVGCARVGEPMRYRIYVEDLIDPADFAVKADAVRAITDRFTQALERLVRRHPEQYFWLHRRWKHQPPVRKAKAA
jgi:Kdo2-lipid IVA lauroyltransferase/acyltransferase